MFWFTVQNLNVGPFKLNGHILYIKKKGLNPRNVDEQLSMIAWDPGCFTCQVGCSHSCWVHVEFVYYPNFSRVSILIGVTGKGLKINSLSPQGQTAEWVAKGSRGSKVWLTAYFTTCILKVKGPSQGLLKETFGRLPRSPTYCLI